MKNRIKIEPLRDRFYRRSDPVEEIVCEPEGRSKVIQNTTRRNEEGREARERLIHQLSSGRREEGSEDVHNGEKMTVHSSRHAANPRPNEERDRPHVKQPWEAARRAGAARGSLTLRSLPGVWVTTQVKSEATGLCVPLCVPWRSHQEIKLSCWHAG